jgi:hypothetical protein
MARWAGAPTDLVRFARTAAAVVAEATENEPATAITVELPGLDIRYDSAEEFERELSARDVPRVGAVTIRIEDNSEADYEVVFRVERGSGAASLSAGLIGRSSKA